MGRKGAKDGGTLESGLQLFNGGRKVSENIGETKVFGGEGRGLVINSYHCKIITPFKIHNYIYINITVSIVNSSTTRIL